MTSIDPMRPARRWYKRLRALVRKDAVERELAEEMAFHLELETQKLVRAGVEPDEARRRAAVAFGGVEHNKEAVRDARWLAWAPGTSLDFRLGLRMLVKYPGLALVGGLGMALATAIGAGSFAFFTTYLNPDLPLDEGERVVSVINWNARRGGDDPHVLHDFVTWRAEARTLVDVGAFRTSRRNLVDAGGHGSPVSVAEMSPSGFRVARVTAVRGRTLEDADEHPGAPPVIVIGHRVWTERYQRDPAILGRTISLGRTMHTIVGVMPEGFAFPVNHGYWIPLRVDPTAYPVGGGPELQVFARLAPGATRERAQAELKVIGARMAAAHPATHEHLAPRIVDYTDIFADIGGNMLTVVLAQAALALLLVLVCLNVAILVYARTVTRIGEIAVRTALGATRRRIVTQLFAEALVLSLLSALAGLGIVAVGLRYVDAALKTHTGGAPFWVNPGLSLGTVLYSLGLAVLGAVIVGVLPALRATRAQLRSTLSTLSGGSRPQLGPVWTAMIVTQVAITVAAIPPAALLGRHWIEQALAPPGFPSEEYVSAALLLEREGSAYADSDLQTPAFRDAMRASQTVLAERLAREPLVAGVTFGTNVPFSHGFEQVAFDGAREWRPSRVARVATNWLDVFGARVVAGRAFTAGDVASPSGRPVVVNRTFVEQMPVRGGVVGQRIRFPRRGDTTKHEWREIVGVIDDFPAGNAGTDDPGDPRAMLYEPMAPGGPQGVTLFVRVRGGASAFVPRLRTVATTADPALQLRRVETLDATFDQVRRDMAMTALALVLGIGSVLLLSGAGIYALMSFTVSQRRREIGVRVALGATTGRILAGVLGRAAGQLGLGVAAGLVLVVVIGEAAGDIFDRAGLLLIPGTALFMAVVGMIAAFGPARRGLRIQPTEALRSD